MALNLHKQIVLIVFYSKHQYSKLIGIRWKTKTRKLSREVFSLMSFDWPRKMLYSSNKACRSNNIMTSCIGVMNCLFSCSRLGFRFSSLCIFCLVLLSCSSWKICCTLYKSGEEWLASFLKIAFPDNFFFGRKREEKPTNIILCKEGAAP